MFLGKSTYQQIRTKVSKGEHSRQRNQEEKNPQVRTGLTSESQAWGVDLESQELSWKEYFAWDLTVSCTLAHILCYFV